MATTSPAAAKAGPPLSPQEGWLSDGHQVPHFGRVLREPLARPALHEPELQNLRRIFPLTWHQSRACTLATLAVPLGCSWIFRPASVSTFSQAAMKGARCTPTPIGTTHSSTITFMVSPGRLPPSWKQLQVAAMSVFPLLVVVHALAATMRRCANFPRVETSGC